MKANVKNAIVKVFDVLILLSSIVIIVNISIHILFWGDYDPENSNMYIVQLIVCSIFILDFIIRIVLTDQPRWKFFWKNILLLLFSIPYLNIIHYAHLEVAPHQYYLLNLIPLFRSAFAFTVILKWFYQRSSANLLVAYLTFLVVAVYVSSLIFFVAEKDINTEVTSWYSAIWWACMDMNTVGSNIIAVTLIGKILSVILACLGMMMLPVFTVYITDKISRNVKAKKAKEQAALNNDNTTSANANGQ